MSDYADSGNSTLPVILAAVSTTAVVCVAGFLFLDGKKSDEGKNETKVTVTDKVDRKDKADKADNTDKAKEPVTEVTKTVVAEPQKPSKPEVIERTKTVTAAPQSQPRADVDLARLARVSTSRSLPPAVGRTGKRFYYSGSMATDRITYTGWGVKGDASGQTITFRWDRPVTISQVGMINGYKKVDNDSREDRYYQNRRVQRVQWRLGSDTRIMQSFQDGRKSPQMEAIEPVTVSEVTIVIQDTYEPGTYKHDDTVISEIYIKGSL